MKNKKYLSLMLVFASLFLLLAGCGAKEKEETPEETEPAINPELISAFGEEFINEEKETIEALVGELEKCYTQFEKDQDLYAACVNLENFFNKYKDGYLKEISDELMTMYKNEQDKEKKAALSTLYLQSIQYVFSETICSFYKFDVDYGTLQLTSDVEEAKESFITCVDSISEFFYCKPISK